MSVTSEPREFESVEEPELWALWKSGARPAARDELLKRHLPYARVVAATYYAKRYHDEIEFDDYYQLAAIGMIEAFDRYDPEAGALFRTFAARRMHGAILDGIARLTEKQQQIAARRQNRIDRMQSIKRLDAIASSEGATQISPADLTMDQMVEYVADIGFGLALSWLLDGTGMIEDGEQAEVIPFYRNAEIKELKDKLMRSIDNLQEQERSVIRYHYLQGMAFKDIAEMLHLTKGRISQIHRRALMSLRGLVQDGAGLPGVY